MCSRIADVSTADVKLTGSQRIAKESTYNCVAVAEDNSSDAIARRGSVAEHSGGGHNRHTRHINLSVAQHDRACEFAREIREGRLGKVLKNPNYRGITVPFWNSLIAVGGVDTLEAYGTPYCGKGEPNQAITVGHRSPACVFKEIEIFGGET